MRITGLMILLAWAVPAFSQVEREEANRPLVLTDAIGLPMSSTQVFNAAVSAWAYSFGQEPGARLLLQDTVSGTIQGTARVNFRSTGLGSREESMGVITYNITIQAKNGQCEVRINHFLHTGNKNAIGGGVNLGPLYAGDRPPEKVPGISMGTATRLHADMRRQAQAHVGEVMKTFAAGIRRAAGQMR